MEFKKYPGIQPRSFKLSRDDSREQRYYISEGGKEYVSVTSFLSKYSVGKESIQQWKDAVGPEEAHRIVTAAATRGTAIHLACENLLLNKRWQDISMFYRQDFIAMKRHLEANVDNIFALEHQMYSDSIGLAGTVDCIAEYAGKLSVIDFKTSNQLKYRCDIDNYFLQCSCYGIMLYERYRIKIDQIVVLMCVEGDPEIQVFIEPFVKWAQKIVKLTKENII